MFNNGFSMRAIAKEMKLHRKTVKTYLDSTCSAVHASYGQKKEGVLSPYFTEVNGYIEKEYTSAKTDEIIRSKVYKCSISTVRHYISKWKSRLKKIYMIDKREESFEFIEREKLLQLLYKPQQTVKELKEEQLSQAYNDYPLYYSVIDIVNQFRKLISDKNVGELESWVKLAKRL